MFYTFSLASSALISVIRPLPVVFEEPRRQRTAKDRRKSSSDRPLEIRRHEFLALNPLRLQKLRRIKSLCVRQSLFISAPQRQTSLLLHKEMFAHCLL